VPNFHLHLYLTAIGLSSEDSYLISSDQRSKNINPLSANFTGSHQRTQKQGKNAISLLYPNPSPKEPPISIHLTLKGLRIFATNSEAFSPKNG
jgi:hypothetical protein